MNLPLIASLDDILSQLSLTGLWPTTGLPQKILFYGGGAGEISSCMAGWIAVQGVEVIVLDGANRFNPYLVSSLAQKALMGPEGLLKRIRIARAFTCYQMATLIGERLPALVGDLHPSTPKKPCVIILGPITTFLDEDVPEREVRPLFERSLRKMEEMAAEGPAFLLFQPPTFSGNFPLNKGGRRCLHDDAGRAGKFEDSRRGYLMKKLFQFSNLVWRFHSDDHDEPRAVLEKSATGLHLSRSANHLFIAANAPPRGMRFSGDGETDGNPGMAL